MADSPRLLSNLRGLRYGEVLLAYLEDAPRIEVYNSFPLNDCPDELWRGLDSDVIARESGATLAILNGPRYWLMDGIGKVRNVEPRLRTFGGIDMRQVATLEVDFALDGQRTPYTERQVNRGAVWHFDAGSTVYFLQGFGAKNYVMQAYCTGVDPTLSEETLGDLGDRLQLPEGWTFTAGQLDEELRIDTTERAATVLQDEFENTYTLMG